nr:carboxypeptidase-like regulatory domain-containing protein [Ignavibacteria bacterium]
MKIKLSGILLLLLLLSNIQIYSQNRSVIKGTITKPDDTPVEGVIIVLTSENTKETGTETDSSGKYFFPDLLPGVYNLK